MRGIVFDIKHCAVHDGPGLRTTVFLKGCPLSCWWCHNPESIKTSPQEVEIIKKVGDKCFSELETVGKTMSVDQVWDEVEKDIIFYEESGGGITISGGEPLHQIEFLRELLMKSKSNNIHSAIDTTGFAPRINFDSIIPFTDLFLYDIKHLDDELHKKYTGVSNKIILQNLESLISHNKKVIVRFPLIPGFNDSDAYINQFINYLLDYKGAISDLHILPYHDNAVNKYKKFSIPFKMNGARSHTDEVLMNYKERFKSEGFEVKIRG